MCDGVQLRRLFAVSLCLCIRISADACRSNERKITDLQYKVGLCIAFDVAIDWHLKKKYVLMVLDWWVHS